MPIFRKKNSLLRKLKFSLTVLQAILKKNLLFSIISLGFQMFYDYWIFDIFFPDNRFFRLQMFCIEKIPR